MAPACYLYKLGEAQGLHRVMDGPNNTPGLLLHYLYIPLLQANV